METVRALVVEDDLFNRDILSRHLRLKDMEVTEVADGPEARDLLLGGDEFDIVLLDINLPTMTGLEVLQEVRQRKSGNELPIILVTALSQSEDVIRGLELGANDYVIKPINASTLMARIATCLKLKSNFEALVQAERQRVMVESMGAACHHVSQPLTVAMGWLANHLEDLPEDRTVEREGLEEVMHWMKEAARIVHAMQDVREYRTVPYMDDERILDLGLSDSPAPEA